MIQDQFSLPNLLWTRMMLAFNQIMSTTENAKNFQKKHQSQGKIVIWLQ